MKISAPVLAIVAMLFVYSCGNKSAAEAEVQKKLLTKKWVYEQMVADGDTVSGEVLGYPTWEFLADSTYKLAFPDEKEDGTWRLDKGKLIIKLNNGSPERQLDIKELGEQKAVLYTQEKNISITLVPTK